MPSAWRGTAAVVVTTLVVWACGQPTANRARKPVDASMPDSADQRTLALRTLLSDQGVTKGLLLSDTAFVYEDGTRLALRRVHFTFYTAQGKRDGVMTARTGSYNSRLSRLEATGDVVVTRNDGKRLTSQQLVYDQARNQIFTDSAFVLVEPNRHLSGIGLESDPQFATVRCLRSCKGVAPVQLPRQ
jgi:LPS export ABC transporter protein LptC